MQPKSISETLKTAKDLLIKKGWIKYSFENRNGYCPYQALTNIGGRYEYQAKCCLGYAIKTNRLGKDKLISSIRNLGTEYHTIAEFNDSKKTTKKDVLNKFNKAIRYAKIYEKQWTPLKLTLKI